MKTLKRWFLVSLVLVICILGFAIWYANTIFAARTQTLVLAGQRVLDSTILQTIQTGEIYTGGPTEYVFFGKDSLGRDVWAFATAHSTYAELAANGLQRDKILSIAKQSPVDIVQVIHALPGLIDPHVQTQFSKVAQSKLVWEVYGKDQNGHGKYAYFDFYTGKLLWTYVLHN
ncbi:hypothetical protein LSG31_17620 [Fodinisporobacter ferrooxydans]|uniref:DUF5590 domain-containing protein n=1 Tax=Fodinisporobacter ferrooxydans TaxID=2901836 RepID=A0ABY4CGP1_9BACL|nr:hypothetical protein LSG31_17620 [Alicyclobacillaceae bacterium MYW30-H2]